MPGDLERLPASASAPGAGPAALAAELLGRVRAELPAVGGHLSSDTFVGLVQKNSTALTYIDKIRVMPGWSRVTGPLLDVSACLLRAREQGGAVHGWALMKQTKRSGPTVYGVLDRLEDCGWITGYWEELGAEDSRPRRRFYQLTPDGEAGVRALLEQRRPEVLRNLKRRSQGGMFPGMAPGGAT